MAEVCFRQSDPLAAKVAFTRQQLDKNLSCLGLSSRLQFEKHQTQGG